MLVIEGILPFAAPAFWRELFKKAIEMTDQQIRVIGLCSMLAGIVLLLLIR